MLIAPADNQWILRQDMGTTTITTDPVPLGGNDRATAILVAHSLFGGAIPADRLLAYVTQVSLDGVHWVTQGPSATVNDAANTPAAVTSDVNGAWVRFEFKFTMQVAGLGGAVFDLKVLLDRK